ncbi:MAG: aspartate-semialdehyde dehydrogenase [Bacteroidales bacterium]
MKIALVGATGLVGSIMLKVLEERGFGHCELLPVASAKSMGKKIIFAHQPYEIISVEDAIKAVPDIAIFSAGSNASLQYALQFAKKGTFVIDNSSAWRSYDHIPLVVPEINGDIINANTKIIANPNCSTIQMVMALAPLHRSYGIKRLVISTYQSVTGTGVKAVNQLLSEREGKVCEKAYPHQIDLNLFPFGGTLESNGYTSEETKLVNETRKILRDKNIQVTATVVRVPVMGGHSESINIEFENEYDLKDIDRLLKEMPGITVLDDPARHEYPMPFFVKDKDEVFVGRIRRDDSQPKSLNIWVVADNLRKGAATNAVQIATLLCQQGLVKS